jgi:hypothetical protein
VWCVDPPPPEEEGLRFVGALGLEGSVGTQEARGRRVPACGEVRGGRVRVPVRGWFLPFAERPALLRAPESAARAWFTPSGPTCIDWRVPGGRDGVVRVVGGVGGAVLRKATGRSLASILHSRADFSTRGESGRSMWSSVYGRGVAAGRGWQLICGQISY